MGGGETMAFKQDLSFNNFKKGGLPTFGAVRFALLTSSKAHPHPPAIHTAVCLQGPKHTPYPFKLCDTIQNKVPVQLNRMLAQ